MYLCIIVFLIACKAPKHVYQAQEEEILNKLYQSENEARKKMAIEYILQAKQKLRLEQFKQAELILLKAMETNEYKNFSTYYLAETFYNVRRYNEALPYIRSVEQSFKQYPKYEYLVQKLKGNVLFELGLKKDALIAYKKCINMHSEDEYVKDRINKLNNK